MPTYQRQQAFRMQMMGHNSEGTIHTMSPDHLLTTVTEFCTVCYYWQDTSDKSEQAGEWLLRAATLLPLGG